MNSTADEKKNEDTHETGGQEENEINNLKLYVLGSIIILTLLGNFLILFLVSSKHPFTFKVSFRLSTPNRLF